MKTVFKLIGAQARLLQGHSLFTQWFANPSISPQGKLSFCPAAIDFVMGFRDLNRYFVRYPEPRSELERALNEHAAEDATHSELFLKDWRLLGVDEALGWAPRDIYWWITSADTLEARRLDFELASLVHHNRDPRLRFAIIESMEAAGNVFFRQTVPLAAQIESARGIELPYFGQFHLDRETGHLQAGGEKLFFAEPLSDHERARATALVLRTFSIFHAHFRVWEEHARRFVAGERPLQPSVAAHAAATLRPTPAHDVTAAMSLSHPAHPSGYGEALRDHLQAAFDELWAHPFHAWIRNGPHPGFLPMIRSFFLQWVVDDWTCADWFLLDTTYADPKTPLERGINRLSKLYAAEMNRRYVEWETLGFDELTGWTAADALQHYWLDERVEEHREVFADLRKLTLDHESPVARYWILKSFVRFGDALMHSIGHAMAHHGVATEAFLAFAGQPERMHPDLPPDPEADAAVLRLETEPMRPEDAALAHELLRATHAQEARRASITWRVLQERRYAHLGPVIAPAIDTTTDFALERSLAASAEAVWEILGDFGAAVRWGAPAMETCVVEGTGVGAVRSLSGQGLTVRERLLVHDPAARRLSYSILEPHPLPFADYVTTIEVSPQGPGACRVRWSASYTPKGSSESASELLEKVYDANLAGVLRALGLIAA